MATEDLGVQIQAEELPVFSSKAHVFQIDPTTKKSWLPCSKQAVTVSFYYDKTKETHRIISVDGTKAIINSTIFPNMNFTKTSQKFGQWSDPKVNSVYGLGFPSEAELNKFAEKFKEARGSTSPLATSSSRQSSGASSPQTIGLAINTSQVNGISRDSPSPQATHTSSIKSNSSTSSNEDEKDGSNQKTLGNNEAQLKYENDRLKMALAQSSTNAKKWETELQTLKNNNARLTAALQESTANVEEWKKQLNAYKEESIRLRKKVQDIESSDVSNEMLSTLTQDKMALEGRIIQLDSLTREKEEENVLLRHTNTELNEQVKASHEENKGLQKKVEELEQKISESSINASADELSSLHQAIKTKLDELNALNDTIPAMVKKNT